MYLYIKGSPLPGRTEKRKKYRETRMAVESENPKSTTAPTNEEQANPNADDDLEEGEIMGGTDESSKKLIEQPHPLEHSWTFWFDNPNAKSKQATWGSSMRSIYTFATVEEFWRYYTYHLLTFL